MIDLSRIILHAYCLRDYAVARRNIIDVNYSRKATARFTKKVAETRHRVALTRFSGFPPVSFATSLFATDSFVTSRCLKLKHGNALLPITSTTTDHIHRGIVINFNLVANLAFQFVNLAGRFIEIFNCYIYWKILMNRIVSLDYIFIGKLWQFCDFK